MKIVPVNDQVSLAFLLFGNKNIVNENNIKSKSSKLKEYIERQRRHNHEFIMNILGENHGAVTGNAARFSHDILMNKKYHKHVALIKQSMMNNNICNQYNSNENIIKQWIIHFAGQGIKGQMITRFLNFKKKYLNDELTRKDMHHVNEMVRQRSHGIKHCKHYADVAKYHNITFEQAVRRVDKREYAKYRLEC